MADPRATELADLVNTTLSNLKKGDITDISQQYQDYSITRTLGERTQLSGGPDLRRKVNTGRNTTAAWHGLHHTDSLTIVDTTEETAVPWCHTSAHMAWERRELLMNRSPERIVDLAMVKRANMYMSVIDILEKAQWSSPTASTDTATPMGIPFWVQKDTTTTVGFNGGDPTGFSAGAGGLDVATYEGWNNCTGRYTGMTNPDMLSQLRKMILKTGFKKVAKVDWGKPNDVYRIYTTEDVFLAMGDIARDNNENHARDLNAFDDNLTMSGTPIVHIPYLTENDGTDNPIYLINHAFIDAVWLKGDYMMEHPAKEWSDKHNTIVVFVDNSMNFSCTDRRRQGVLYYEA